MDAPPKILISHRLQYFAYRTVEKGLRLLSLPSVFALGEFLGRVTYRLTPNVKHIVLRNLRIAFGREKSEEELEALAHDVFERTGANLLSSLRIPFLSDEEILSHVTYINPEIITAPSRTEGVILVAPHMGNWELLAHATFLTGTTSPIGTHYRPLSNPLIDRVIKRRRTRRGLHLFAKKSSTHKLTKFIRDGGILGILADQRVGSKGAPGLFFGRPTTCSPMPPLLARRAKGTLVGMYCETSAPCHWTIHLSLIPETTTQSCADSLEKAWRNSPADVFWLQERWKLQGSRPLDFLYKYPEGTQAESKIHLVSLLSKTEDFGFPESLITINHLALDLAQSNEMITQALQAISQASHHSIDAFIVEKTHLKRLKKLAKNTRFLSPENIRKVSNLAQ